MPTLPQILSQLQFITQEATLLGLFVTAGAILVGRDWRSLILALLLQYILVGLTLSHLVRPDIATLKVMIGAFICPILFLSARQVSFSSLAVITVPTKPVEHNNTHYLSRLGRILSSLLTAFKGEGRRLDQSSPTSFIFRVLAALLILLISITLGNTFVLTNLSPSVTTAVYWLVLAGLVTLILSENPMKVGHGLFTTLTGFELLYATMENSLLITGLWGAVNLLIALAIGYLTITKGIGQEEDL